MPRERKINNPQYQEFLRQTGGIAEDPDPRDKETFANEKEIGWWKQLQIRRAIHIMRYGIATPEQLSLLKRKKIPVSAEARKRTKQEMTKY